ncbi:DUF3016 domain-containing protein [Massilia glaciei]|uniref:DUF3016 domain-containing protein n=1 Tax=Massilia glaciei TaxID=1524097 RepID=A0A2U2HM04_9BURK|nr:DUF3016 domain-containing protein [Massilia glaciei]PWF48466.1 DUF3016 domain-containing protein [Massilia glaciei]
MKTLKSLSRCLAGAGVLLFAAGSASAGVAVEYKNANDFFDVPKAADERARVLTGMTKHFEKLGASLPAGQQLDVEVLDIDLAGRVEPRYGHGEDVRILRGGSDWPSMQVRYTLRSGEQVLASGEGKLRNMMYSQRSNRYKRDDALRYEKQMIDEWFTEISSEKKIVAR